MHLEPEDWALLSQRLDQALELPEHEWPAWLDRQTDMPERLRLALREQLADEAAGRSGNSLPPLPHYPDTGPPAAAVLALQAGAAVGPYRIVRELGRGGMGSVWLAERSDGVLKRPVALKLPHTGLASTQLAERLARERDILASLSHPHIARLYDAGITEQGQPYLALEYIEGQALLDYARARSLGLLARLNLVLQVLDAVQYAHGRLVVHRDIKPGNILVTDQGEVRLLDFGVAKLLQGADGGRDLTETAFHPMTPQYAAPEQILGQPVGIAADIYAVGMVLFELLSDARPYRLARDTRGALEQAILDTEPQPPSQAALGQVAWAQALRGDLDTIVLKALKKAPEQRYTTAAAFADDLRRHLAGEPVLARPDSFAYRSGKFLKRHKWPVAAGTTAMLALVTALGVALWQARVAREQTALARQEAAKAQKESATAQAINDFMQGVFFANSAQQDDPAMARNRTARELLDIAAGRIDDSLKDAPEAKLAMLKVFSEIYDQLGLYEPSLAMMERQVAATRQLHGNGSIELVNSLLVLYTARRLHNVDDPAQAVALSEAGRALEALPSPSSESQMLYRVDAAEYLVDHEPERARRMLGEGLTLAQQQAAQPVFGDENVMFVKIARQELQLGECAPAKRHADQAVARSREMIRVSASDTDHSVGGHMALVPALELSGWARHCLGEIPQAESLLREALAAGRNTFGPDDLGTLGIEARLAGLLWARGQPDESRSLRDHVLATLATHSAQERSRLHFDTLAAAAQMQVRMKDWSGALNLSRRALGLRDPGIQASPYVAELLRTEAAALAGLGRRAEAQTALARAVATRQKAQVTSGPALAEEAAIAAALAGR